jgi:hypothetical protein
MFTLRSANCLSRTEVYAVLGLRPAEEKVKTATKYLSSLFPDSNSGPDVSF